MELEHEFTVPVGTAKAWKVLLDVERIAPCMPGATVLDVHGDEFTGTVKVKVGPIAMTYAGEARFVEKDEANSRVVLRAAGKENRGSGTAEAAVTATLTPSSDGAATTVHVQTDLTVTGRPAQFGRGMLQDIGGKLIGQFADRLADTLRQEQAEPEPAERTSGKDDPAVTPPVTAQEDDALDLLAVSGASGLVARYKVPLGVAAVGLVLGWLVLMRRHRRRA